MATSIPQLDLTDRPITELTADSLVLGVCQASGETDSAQLLAPGELPESVRNQIATAITALGVTGATDQVVRIPAPQDSSFATITLAGLGTCAQPPLAEELRLAAGAASRALAGSGSAVFSFPAATAAALRGVAEGALFGAYGFSRHRSTEPKKAPLAKVTVAGTDVAEEVVAKVADQACGMATSLALVRDLVNTAPGDLAPADFVTAARDAAAGLPIEVQVWDESQLAASGFGGILGVGQGSTRPPRLLKLSYSPPGAEQHIALIGKGVTFDTGGISLKPPASMETMKCDMAGGATVLGAIIELARRQTPVRVTTWVPLAENMPSGAAIRPSDVLTMFGGRTVEVLNTDAEGRLILADALVAASEEHPTAIVDVATLTGAQMMALGNRYSAIMSNAPEFSDRVRQAAASAGESIWPMPLPEDLRSSLDSTVADLQNIGERMGGMLVAGLFLREFVGQQETSDQPIDWAHLDIAGPAYNSSGAWGYTPKGGTGHALRTLVDLVEQFAS